MKKKLIKRISLSILSLLAVGGVCFYVAIWHPHRQFMDEGWWRTATTEQKRLLCHRLISLWIRGPHDAFLVLEKIGNKDSVPLLVRQLKWQNPSKDGCVTQHCVDALRSLTGEDFGADYRKWDEWWRKIGNTLPPTNFHQRPVARQRVEG